MSEYDSLMKDVLAKMRLRRPVEADQGKMREAMRRGNAAKALRENEDLAKAFETVESVYLNAWRSSAGTEVETRERCHMAVMLLSDLKNYLLACVENGEAARAALEKIANR